MKKFLRVLMPLLTWGSVIFLFVDFNHPWAIVPKVYLCCLIAAIVLQFVGMIAWGIFMDYLVPHLPIPWQRPFFKIYQKRCLKIADNLDGLLAFPFVMFVEIELPRIFEQGGMAAAYNETQAWPDRMQHRLLSVVETLVEEKERRCKAQHPSPPTPENT